MHHEYLQNILYKVRTKNPSLLVRIKNLTLIEEKKRIHIHSCQIRPLKSKYILVRGLEDKSAPLGVLQGWVELSTKRVVRGKRSGSSCSITRRPSKYASQKAAASLILVKTGRMASGICASEKKNGETKNGAVRYGTSCNNHQSLCFFLLSFLCICVTFFL